MCQENGTKIGTNKMTDYYEIKNISFGDLNEEDIHEILRDGRLASHFLERQLCVWYPHLTFVDGRGHDHVDTEGNLYDQKCFTKGGLNFAPSNMIGKGRSLDEDLAHAHAKTITYIACDIIDFPKVKVRFVKGEDLLEDYPKCKVPFKDRNLFFGLDNDPSFLIA